jgi:peptide/nickel transport system ATP-binding protein
MTALNPVMRIGEQICEVFDAHMSVPANEKRQRILAALTDVGLPEPELLIDAYPFRLSGGQRQRVMIACALILEPVLLICDEPTTALDVTTQAQILALVRELQQRRGTAVLFITHDFGVVSEIADHVVVMQTGKVVEAGPARDVLQAPQHPYTRKLIDAIPTGTATRGPSTSDAPYVLQVQDLCKTYRSGNGLFKRGRAVQAAKDISFDLRRAMPFQLSYVRQELVAPSKLPGMPRRSEVLTANLHFSPRPGMKTRMSPGSLLLMMRPTASAACAVMGRWSGRER